MTVFMPCSLLIQILLLKVSGKLSYSIPTAHTANIITLQLDPSYSIPTAQTANLDVFVNLMKPTSAMQVRMMRQSLALLYRVKSGDPKEEHFVLQLEQKKLFYRGKVNSR